MQRYLGIDRLQPEDREAVLRQLEETIRARAFAELLDAMPDEDRKELRSVVERGDDNEIKRVLRKKVPEYKQVLGSAIRRATDEFRQATAAFQA